MDRNEAKSILETYLYELSNQMGSEWCRKKHGAIQEAIKALEQPEIIRCKDCKNWKAQVKDIKGDGLGCCIFHKANFVTGEGYCYWAERKTDES